MAVNDNMKELQSNEFWRKKFWTALKIADTDRDGKITKLDFTLIIERYKDIGAPEEHLKKLEIALTDIRNASGIVDDTTSLTYDQFAANFMKAMGDGDNHDKIFGIMFDIIDEDGNGEISFKEWDDYYKVIKVDSAYAKAPFDAMDVNGDGMISKEEYVEYIKEFYFTAEDRLKSSLLYGPLVD